MWIRVETNEVDSDRVMELGELCGISAEAAYGFLSRFRGNMAEHRPKGDVARLSDSMIEKWAGWAGMPTVFATAFRKTWIENGILVNWTDKNGKLLERMEKDRVRKLRGTSAENPRLQNVTGRKSPSLSPRTGARAPQDPGKRKIAAPWDPEMVKP